MKKLYCKECGTLVAKIAEGSQLRKGMVCYCEKCEQKKALSDWADKTKSKAGVPGFDSFMDNMGGIFNK